MTKSLIERVEAGYVPEASGSRSGNGGASFGTGKTPEIVRLLEALNRRPIETQELAGFARVMRRHATRVFADDEARPTNMVDTCGTGGGRCEHVQYFDGGGDCCGGGGRESGEAWESRGEFAERLGQMCWRSWELRIDLPFERYGRAIREIGIGFLLASSRAHRDTACGSGAKTDWRAYHFNLLGPLTNPAGAQAQVLGVFFGGCD